MHDIEIERSMGEEVSNNRNDDHRPEREGGKKPLGRSRCFDGFFFLSLSLSGDVDSYRICVLSVTVGEGEHMDGSR